MGAKNSSMIFGIPWFLKVIYLLNIYLKQPNNENSNTSFDPYVTGRFSA